MSEVPVTPPAPLDTGKVPDRRALPFESVGQGLADAERAGRLRRLGNWTLGQALGHLAAWAEYGYTGFPLRVPFFIRWYLRRRAGRSTRAEDRLHPVLRPEGERRVGHHRVPRHQLHPELLKHARQHQRT